MFLTLMAVGLVGLLMMALPALGRQGHGHVPHGGRAILGHRAGAPRFAGGPSGAARTALVASTAGAAASAASAGRETFPAESWPTSFIRLLPSPRAICSVLALYGAFGNALVDAGHLRFSAAALAATVPALLVERFVVRPVWNLLFRFQGQPSSPLEDLLFSNARAVSVVRDGRAVQLAATLREDHAAVPVKLGDTLRIDDVDARRERVTVSVVGHTQES